MTSSNFTSRLALAASPLAIGLALMATPAAAQTAPDAAQASADAEQAKKDADQAAADAAKAKEDADTIVVTGFRRSLESAVQTKKYQEQIVESVSAEDIGKLPDSSIGESIEIGRAHV